MYIYVFKKEFLLVIAVIINTQEQTSNQFKVRNETAIKINNDY